MTMQYVLDCKRNSTPVNTAMAHVDDRVPLSEGKFLSDPSNAKSELA